LTVAIPGVEVTRAELQKAFEEAYWNRFEVELPEIRAVLVNLDTAVVGSRKAVPLEALAATDGQPDTSKPKRAVWFEQGWLDTPIFERRNLPAGSRLQGPAVIEQLDTTIVVEPGNQLTADDLGNLIIKIDGGIT
jgi:N-methylhydantoinase A